MKELVLKKRLPSQVTPVQKLELQSEDCMEQGVEEKTLFDLKQIDPLTDKCIVTLISLAEKEQCCYRACIVCSSRIILGDDGYDCTKDGCSCKQYDWKYKVCFIAADDTYSLQFMFSEKKGGQTANSKKTKWKDILVYRARQCRLLLLLTVVDTTFVT